MREAAAAVSSTERKSSGSRAERALARVESRLLEHLGPAGHWRGELSASALSTATACFAIFLVDAERRRAGGDGLGEAHRERVERGLDWLARHTNADGGWGDTTVSRSNPSTTLLAWATLEAAGSERRHHTARAEGRAWLERHLGSVEPGPLKEAIEGIYGEDRTFSIPILALCALTGVLGPRREAFAGVTALPFELAALPQSWFRFIGLPVVSYALPALIAVGQVQHHLRPSWNPLLRGLRQGLRGATLDRLRSIQPSSGGYLEAVPLTSFVTLSLAGAGEARHPVVESGLGFLASSVRDDGSWPIDEDLATWVSTLAIQGLTAGTRAPGLSADRREILRKWLLGQQYREKHPFTGAAPGGWAWTDLPGGVPDADDTPGALLALRQLGARDPEVREAAASGLAWLLDLQNRDGGIPTFCRGWGRLPFDRSSADLTAHALRAFAAWRAEVSAPLARRIDGARRRALGFLADQQRADGSWLPLWFGNEAVEGFENPVYGTARVLRALDGDIEPAMARRVGRGVEWLLAAQGDGGGWGGAPGVEPSIEETALALDTLASFRHHPGVADAISHGVAFLTARIEAGDHERPSPIGFYFANLWYHERLYPLVFSVAALRRCLA